MLVEQSATLLAMTPHALTLLERAGRVCYQSEGDDAASFVRMIIDRGHESVLEHASATFSIVCSRGISHEIVRHRLASYSQESTRYVKYGDISIVEGQYTDKMLAAIKFAEEAYTEACGGGLSAQWARNVLPIGLKTQIVVTANFRQWRHMIRLRTASGAHPSIVALFEMIRDQLQGACKVVFDD